MQKIKLFIIIILAVFVAKCSYENKNCNPKSVQFGNDQYTTTGCLTNNLENGIWSFYNERDKLIEKGNYNNGVREGKWIYPENKSDSIIDWKIYKNDKLGLIFNIPKKLSLIEDSSTYLQFSNLDSLNPFYVLLSIHSIEETHLSINNYYKQGEKELSENDLEFVNHKNKILSENNTYYFNFYEIKKHGRSNNILNSYKALKNNYVFEISCRYTKETEASAKIIFFSILTSSFLQNERFMNPFEKLKNVIEY